MASNTQSSRIWHAAAAIVLTACQLSYGIFYLLLSFLHTLRSRGTVFERDQSEKDLHPSVSHGLWSLQDDPNSPLSHNFIKLHDGTQLHYLSARISVKTLVDSLIIFLHGFPDSSALWTQQLRSASPSNLKLAALDLPGCGGSDDLDQYGPDNVLNCLCEAILLLKKRYLGSEQSIEHRKCVLVGHDWGGIIAFRLAAETKGLLDHVIVMNSVYPPHFEAIAKARIAKAGQHLQTLRNNPLHLSALSQAATELRPIFTQTWKFGYRFMFMLPIPLARVFPGIITSLIRTCNVLLHKSPKSKPSPLTLATSWSASCGPSTAEATSATLQGEHYGRSVLARSKTNPPGAWDGRVRLYNENLAAGPWRPSPLLSAYVPATSTSMKGPGLTSEDPPAQEKFKCHVQVVFGMRDIALDPRMCLEGIERYFAGSTLSEGKSSLKSSANAEGDVVVLPESGHWSPLDRKGREALENLLERLVGLLNDL